MCADPRGILALARPFLLAPKVPKPLPILTALAGWLDANRPDLLVSCMPQENLVAVQARRLAAVATRLVLTEHNTLSEAVRRARSVSYRALPAAMGRPNCWTITSAPGSLIFSRSFPSRAAGGGAFSDGPAIFSRPAQVSWEASPIFSTLT